MGRVGGFGLVTSRAPPDAPAGHAKPLTAIEQASIDSALEFANLRQIESVEQVVGIFAPVAKLTQSPIFQTIPDMDIGAFVDDRDELVQWLAHPEHICGDLKKVLKRDATWDLTPDFELVSTARPRLDGVQACTAFAVALLFDRDRGLARWLGRYAFPNCYNWFFAWRPAPVGNCAASRT